MKKIRLLLILFFAFAVSAATFNAGIVSYAKTYSEGYGLNAPMPDRAESEYINYSRKEETFFYFDIPSYTTTNNKSVCGPVSGTIVTGYYAFYYPALMPGFKTYGYNSAGEVLYYDFGSSVIQEVIDTYTNIMSAQNGCTVANYKIGMDAYFRLIAGVTIYFDRLVQSSGGLHWNSCVQELNARRPIALFLSYYNISYIGAVAAGQDKMINHIYINNHIVTSDGYYIIKYYQTQGGVETLFRTDYYLYVQTGWETHGYVYLGRNLTVDDAYGMGIVGLN